jgi:hypothetical protein
MAQHSSTGPYGTILLPHDVVPGLPGRIDLPTMNVWQGKPCHSIPRPVHMARFCCRTTRFPASLVVAVRGSLQYVDRQVQPAVLLPVASRRGRSSATGSLLMRETRRSPFRRCGWCAHRHHVIDRPLRWAGTNKDVKSRSKNCRCAVWSIFSLLSLSKKHNLEKGSCDPCMCRCQHKQSNAQLIAVH